MSESVNTSPEAGEEGGTTAPANDEFKPVTSQDDLNRIIADRVARERAKYADYKDLKVKAARLDEIEAANKTEAQKLADAVAAAEKERDDARAEALRMRIATKHGITDAEDIDLFLTGTDEETLTRQAERLAGRASDRRKQGNVAPREGVNSSATSGDDMREFTRNLFATAD